MKYKKCLMIAVLFVFIAGCATPKPNSYILRNWAYEYTDYRLQIIYDPPGARIEWNEDYIGRTPLTRILNGRIGYVGGHIRVKAYPVFAGQHTQTKILTNPIPRTIYFDMNLVSTGINVNIY